MLLDETGHIVKLADFGTSIRCNSYLQDNVPRGTEAFMAPEVSSTGVVGSGRNGDDDDDGGGGGDDDDAFLSLEAAFLILFGQ